MDPTELLVIGACVGLIVAFLGPLLNGFALDMGLEGGEKSPVVTLTGFFIAALLLALVLGS